MALCVKIKNIVLQRIDNQDHVYGLVDTTEIETTKKVILRPLQAQAFPTYVKVLQKFANASHTDRATARHRNNVLRKGSNLYRLENGLV